MKDRKMVLFDWNGTLIADTPIWYKGISKIFELYNISPPSIEDYCRELLKFSSYAEFYHSLGINLTKEELDEIYQKEYQKYLGEIQLSPGVEETLDLLSQKAVLGIISIQLRSLFDPVFLRLGLEKYFKHVVTEAKKKSALIVHLCLLEKIKLQNCYYVGDAPSDVRHAKNAGVKSIAYLTKHAPIELILSAKPDFTISHFVELPKLIGE